LEERRTDRLVPVPLPNLKSMPATYAQTNKPNNPANVTNPVQINPHRG